ncbi:MAG: sigma-54-dependent Fis family transcriptional regulator, partial [Deltaproteobacteria bacterium]|nr:sigma-54-dependent Fis family transcriptional regulator [Deltaproteobacteria bacterium]
MRRERILVVDDEPSFREALAHFLTLEDFAVLPLADSYEALQAARQEEVDIVLTDLTMPGLDGIELLKQIRELRPHALGIIMTGYGTIETAVNAMKAGAFDYVTKPFQFDEIKIVIERALEHRRLLTENIFLRRYLREKFKFENIVGDCDRMQEVFALIEKVADSDSTVLIYGESGTGKELVARAIHFNSRRRDKLLVPVNCGAIPEELLESELFGHVRGAFTGANTTRMGRFELGHGGTIFLDEISEMSPKLQVKLLRVLQTQEFEPLGGVKTIKVDIRVIAATNQDLTKAMAAKRFREDLFYRLNVIPLCIPPLRERKEDIPLLAGYFLARY